MNQSFRRKIFELIVKIGVLLVQFSSFAVEIDGKLPSAKILILKILFFAGFLLIIIFDIGPIISQSKDILLHFGVEIHNSIISAVERMLESITIILILILRLVLQARQNISGKYTRR